MKLYALLDREEREMVRVNWMWPREAAEQNASFSRMQEPVMWLALPE